MAVNYANKRTLGTLGETKAKEYLEDAGYNILFSNFRAGKIGELDLIAKKDNIISFVEVKSRQTNSFGYPSEALTYSKVKNIKTLAEIFLKHLPFDIEKFEIRFDVIEVYFSYSEQNFIVKNINHIENAF